MGVLPPHTRPLALSRPLVVRPEACPVRRPRLASSFLNLVSHLPFPRCIPLHLRDRRLCLRGLPLPQLGRDPLPLGQPCRLLAFHLGPACGLRPPLCLSLPLGLPRPLLALAGDLRPQPSRQPRHPAPARHGRALQPVQG